MNASLIGGTAQYRGFTDLEKTGDSIWTLTGTGAFAGATTVKKGTLLVDGSIANSSVAVKSGATLGGIGTVGHTSVEAGGIIAPGTGGGIATLYTGNITFDAGSIYRLAVDAAGQSGSIAASGAANIHGGTVEVLAGTGNYAPQTRYTILTAADGLTVNGAFGATSNLAFLVPTLSYDPGNVYLVMTRNDLTFEGIGITPNQIATGAAIESLGAGNPIYNAVVSLSEPQAQFAFDQFSGEIHASAKMALIEDSRFVRDAINDRLRAAFDDAGASHAPVLAYGPGDSPVPVAADHAGPVFWSQGFGSWGSTDGDGNPAGLDRSTGGLLIGADGRVGDWRIGLLAGYSHSSFDAKDRASSGKSGNYHLGLYGGTQWGNVALRTGAAYAWHDIDTSRAAVIPGVAENLSAGYDAGTFQAFGELGYGIDRGDTRFEPFANLAYVNLHGGSFAEQGGDGALKGGNTNTDVTFTTLGLRAEHSIALGTLDATLRGMAGWRHAFGDTTPTSAMSFVAGSNAFSIAGVPIARNSAVVEAGLDLNLTPRRRLRPLLYRPVCRIGSPERLRSTCETWKAVQALRCPRSMPCRRRAIRKSTA